MGGRSMRGTKTYGGSGTSHSITTAFGVSQKHKTAFGFPWNGKFSTMDEIEAYLGGDTIQCLECGREMKSLCKHLSIHGISDEAYKEKYGIPFSRALVVKDVRESFSRNMKALNEEWGEDAMNEIRAKARRMAMLKSSSPRKDECAAVKEARVRTGKANKGRKHPERASDIPTQCSKCGDTYLTNIYSAGRKIRHCPECARKERRAREKEYKDRKMEESNDKRGI